MNLATTDRGVGWLWGDEVALLGFGHRDVGSILRAGESLAGLRSTRVAERVPLGDVELLPPVLQPAQIWGVGLNYTSRARAAGRAIPTQPLFFLTAPSALTGAGTLVPLPEHASQVDYEAELAVVIGRRVSHCTESDAWGYVAGITAANDLTARDVHRQTGSASLAKSFPGFLPLGGSLLTVDEIEKPDDIRLRATVNGELRQEATTADLIFSVGELIARLSRFTVLEPGDVILTGSPSGTGQDLDAFLADGDSVTVSVEGVVDLTNRVVAPVSVYSETKGVEDRDR